MDLDFEIIEENTCVLVSYGVGRGPFSFGVKCETKSIRPQCRKSSASTTLVAVPLGGE